MFACYHNDNLTSIREERNKKKEKRGGLGEKQKEERNVSIGLDANGTILRKVTNKTSDVERDISAFTQHAT